MTETIKPVLPQEGSLPAPEAGPAASAEVPVDHGLQDAELHLARKALQHVDHSTAGRFQSPRQLSVRSEEPGASQRLTRITRHAIQMRRALR